MVEEYIKKWIENISLSRKELNDFPICPFAKKSKYKIIQCNSSEIVVEDGYDVIIFVVEENFTCDEILNWIKIHNNKNPEWKFFKDCASPNTFIKDIQTNNGKYNLIIAQPKGKLKKLRESLLKTNYYSYYDNDYLKEILEDDYNLLKEG